MILGVDHIALSCEDIVQATEFLKQYGFSIQFIDKSVPNPPAKEKLLRSYHPIHSLAYCKGASGISVEVIQHGTAVSAPSSFYQVRLQLPAEAAFQRMEPDPQLSEIWSKSCGLTDLTFGSLPAFHATFWNAPLDQNSKTPAVRTVMIPIQNMPRALNFWTGGLGARVAEQGETHSGIEWVKLKIVSPVAVWSAEVVLARFDVEKPFLDSPGFTCLAFLTNNLEQEVNRLADIGAREITEPFFLSVNNKPLKIVLLRGPSDELIELIQITR